QDYGV
ncbi:unnamed protein product, partial [Allacma fusca]